MKLRKIFTIFAVLLLFVIIFIVYSFKDLSELTNIRSSITEDFEENKWLHFEKRIRQLEAGLDKHHEAVNQIRQAMKNIISTASSVNSSKTNSSLALRKIALPPSKVLYDHSCSFQLDGVPYTDIQMLKYYEKMNFENKDGGAWKQGWKIEIDEKQWTRTNKLKVFVVPHSHNDPGWIKTFDDYYITQTKHILNNMLRKLPEDPRRKFIWAEISFFAMWWEELNDEEKETVKNLIRRNQLEIVSGGWVMNDEANSHWVSIVQQYTDGHQWLQHNLNYTPVSSWSIDPFGMSFTQPALLKAMGFQSMLIQRVHYSVKKQLASEKNLEFRWRQLWDSKGKSDMFTHMMPFYSYDIPHTCGPDPKICCQFDFKRLHGYGLSCPWKIAPQIITDKNVAQRAALLLDQYRKKSTLFKTDVVLAPLGDDFRYDHSTEWDAQYNNYQKLFDFMNSEPELHVMAQFGTLTDYFNAVFKEMKKNDFPVLSGDFFTYADRDEHYWSGYYTSKPFYKRMDRVLMFYIRSAETILTLAHLKYGIITEKELALQKLLIDARKSHSLFQHHDGITGTAKDSVVKDYAKKMLLAIQHSQNVIQYAAHMLLNKPEIGINNQDTLFYNIDDIRHTWNELEEHYPILIGPELRTKKIVIFNSLTFTRIEVVTFYVSIPHVEVLDFNGKHIECQISPIFEYASTISQTKYQLSFIVNVPAYSLISYTINAVWPHELPKFTKHASIKVFNEYVAHPTFSSAFRKFEIFTASSEFTLRNSRVTASFNKQGLLKAIKCGTVTIPVHLDFIRYGVKRTAETSGAYLFIPDGEGKPMEIEHRIVNVVEGPILSFVMVQLPYVLHIVRLYNSPGADTLGIEIENIVDIRKTSNYEIAMRFSTNINSTDEFFTDVNGYQVVRRKRFDKLPLQANFYPMPTLSYIEDENTRFTLITSSPLGCSSLKSGQLEVMLDRRLKQDDNLGLGQGVLDNVPTRQFFRLLLERKTHTCRITTKNHPAGFPTLSAYISMETLLNPLIKLLRTDDNDMTSFPMHVPMDLEFGVDYTITSLRPNVTVKGKDYVGLILHRTFVDTCFTDRVLLKQFPLSTGSVNIGDSIPAFSSAKVYTASLSYLKLKNEVDIKSSISLCPMEIQAYAIQL